MKKFNLNSVNRKTFIKLLLILSPVILLLGLVIWWKINTEPVDISKKEKVNFVINRGDGIAEVSRRLKEQNLIKSPLCFQINVLFMGLSKKIQAGNFYLFSSMSETEIALTLTKAKNDKWVTIVEGLRQEQIGEVLIKEGFNVNLKIWVNNVRLNQMEGKIFPDSYLLPETATEGAILKLAYRNFQKKIERDLTQKITQSGLTLNQILTLASIVEREAQNDGDRKIVAGILLKRLKSGWPLQVDATIQYAVASAKCQRKITGCDWWPKKLSKNDLSINSGFNTYLNTGFPPGPICNPGLSSIRSVLEPQDSAFWFYISDQSGIMHYAGTQEEHSANIARYLY